MNPFQILFDLTTSFYSVMTSLFTWFADDINLIGITFSPFDIIFNWITLSAILIAVMVKNLVPLT